MPADPAASARRCVLVVALLSILGFGTNLFIATEFDNRHAYAGWETLFSSDPNWYLQKLTDGSYSSRRHPLFHVFVSFPARAAAHLISGVTGADDGAVTRQLVLLASPLASGIKTAMLLAFCLTVGLGLRSAALIALIDMASLSRLIFGSIPESFGATGLALTWMLYLAARALRQDRRSGPSFVSWFVCGLFASGVTVTNIVPLAILFAGVLIARTGEWRSALLRSASLAGLVIAAAAALHVASQVFVRSGNPRSVQSASLRGVAAPQPDRPGVLENISPFVSSSPLFNLRQVPGGTAATFFAPPALTFSSEAPPRHDRARSRLHVGTMQFSREWLLCIALSFGVLGVALFALRRVTADLQRLALAIAGVLAFTLVLFTVWGVGGVFLYTLHWQPLVIALLAIAGTTSSSIVRGVVAANVLLLGMELIWNVRFLAAAWAAL
jgi:hypothetical protein